MGFVCEYVSEVDVEKYNLKDMWLKYNRFKDKSAADQKRFQWSINREISSYLMIVKQVVMDHLPLNDFTWIFHFNDNNYEIKLNRGDSTSKNSLDNPFIVSWNLIGVYLDGVEVQLDGDALASLKDALMSWGYSGMNLKKENCKYQFEF